MPEEERKPTSKFGGLADQYATIGGNERTRTPAHEYVEQRASRRYDVKTLKQQNTEGMKRQTVYMPEDLAIRLKIYAAQTKADISGIITDLVEKFLDQVE